MKVKCGWCDRIIEVQFLPYANDVYICQVCKGGYEAGRFKDLVRKRIEKKEIGKDEKNM